ncbi:MAG: DUF2271 domain-containing protein [Treponema sp.]|jgi:hypothetical protein|nr:DUF2271 domain-containing protein [Treponema sp.]
MKRLFLIILLTTLVFAGAAAQIGAQQLTAAELSFTFTRQSGTSSNQFAIWIENAQGQFIKTIYATRYTANGGWKRRASSLPVWVRKSGLSGLNNAQVEALTGATPRTGSHSYFWDGTDNRGTPVPAGDYVIFLEGTLRRENQVMYRAPIRLGRGPETPEVTVVYTGDSGVERTMIGNVTVRTLR